jgi:hypothetical protein
VEGRELTRKKFGSVLEGKEVIDESFESFLVILIARAAENTVTAAASATAATTFMMVQGRSKEVRNDVDSATPCDTVGNDDGCTPLSGRLDPERTPERPVASGTGVVLVHVEGQRMVLFSAEERRNRIVSHIGVSLVAAWGTTMVGVAMRRSARRRGTTVRWLGRVATTR